MYDNSMYATIPPELEWSNPLCEDCPYAEDSLCWKLGCIKEKTDYYFFSTNQ